MFWAMRTLDRLHVEVQNTWTKTPPNRSCISIKPFFGLLAMMPLCSPSFSRTVAYLEFAKGHDWRLQKPVALYSFLQKFCVAVLLKQAQLGQNFRIHVLLLDFVRAELLVYYRPNHIVALHRRFSEK